MLPTLVHSDGREVEAEVVHLAPSSLVCPEEGVAAEEVLH